MANLDTRTVNSLETPGKHSTETNMTGQNSSIADAAASAYSLATRSFTSQELPNIPTNNKDCGPTSLVTVLKSDGVFSDSGNAAAQEAATRLRMTGADNPLQATNVKQLFAAAQSYGLTAQRISGLAELNTALAQGKTVIEGGAPSYVLNGVNFKGNNVNNDPSGRHFVTVFGFNPRTGNYLVDNSALSPGSGPQEKSVAQMKAFISDVGLHAGIAVTPHSNSLKLANTGLMLGTPEIKSASSFSEMHRSSATERFRQAADIDIQIPLLTLRF